MVKFLIVTCIFATWLVMVANSAYYDLNTQLSSAPSGGPAGPPSVEGPAAGGPSAGGPAAGGPSAGGQAKGPSAGGPSAGGTKADCSSLIYKMFDCLKFLEVDGTDSKPDASCCSGLKQVVKIDAHCICEGFKSAARLGVTIDMKKAATLPSACKVSAPSISSCNGSAPRVPPVNPPQLAPPFHSPKPSVPRHPPTANPPKPAAPSGAPPTPADQAPAPVPATSGTYTTCSLFLAPLTLIAALVIF